MLEQVRNFFLPPVFPEDEDKSRKAVYAHVAILVLMVAAIAYEAFVRYFASSAGVSIFELIMIGFALSCLAGLMLLKKGYVRFTSILLIALIWFTSNGLAATSYVV